jgi:hypothetical protein
MFDVGSPKFKIFMVKGGPPLARHAASRGVWLLEANSMKEEAQGTLIPSIVRIDRLAFFQL